MTNAKGLSRETPEPIRRQLRRQVGFGCPVNDCRSPFLEYHHFDPPWHVRQHHDLEGLVPLCPTHHGQAEALSPQEVRDLKKAASELPIVRGRFLWMKREILAVVGGNAFHETPVVVQLGDQPVVWFERDDQGRALLNVRMISSPENYRKRLRIVNNDFVLKGNPVDFRCSVNGRVLTVAYENKDSLRIEFREAKSPEALVKRFGFISTRDLDMMKVSWPLTVVQVSMSALGGRVRLGPTTSKLPGFSLKGCIMSHCGVGVQFGHNARPHIRPDSSG